MSYNPTYDAHQVEFEIEIFENETIYSSLVKNLLRQAVDVELDKLEKESKLLKQLATPLTQAEAAPIKVLLLFSFS